MERRWCSVPPGALARRQRPVRPQSWTILLLLGGIQILLWTATRGEFLVHWTFNATFRLIPIQLMQVKLTLSAINLAFFLDKLPTPELDGWEAVETVVKQPQKSWIMLKKWDSVL